MNEAFVMNNAAVVEADLLMPTDVDPLEPLDPKRLRRNPFFTRGSWVLLAALVACGSFAMGARSKEAQASALPAGLPAGFPAGLGGGAGGLPDIAALLGGGGGAGATSVELATATTSSGEIIVVSQGKIYLKMADGSTKAVALGSGTTVLDGTLTDANALAVGQTVIVDGRPEENGVLAANQVVISP
jgi:hypothetical protein